MKVEQPAVKFDPRTFIVDIYEQMQVKGADAGDAMSVAVNLLLNVMLVVIAQDSEATPSIQAIAGGLRRGFKKVEDAPDAKRCQDVLANYANFGLRAKG
jgi:hypothetical protein